MKKLRAISLILSLALAATLLFGCSASKDEPDKPEPSQTADSTKLKPAAESGKITMRFMWWGGDERHKATLAAIKDYEAANTNVKIDAEYMGFDGYYQKLTTQIAGGEVPDVVQLDQPWLLALTNQDSNMFVDLNTMKDYIDLSQFDSSMIDDYVKYNNQIVGVPTGTNGSAFLVNKTLADKAGIDTSVAWNWDNLLEAGKKLNAYDPESYLVMMEWDTLYGFMVTRIIQNTGGNFISDDYTLNFTKEQLTEEFNYILKLLESHVIEPFEQSSLYAVGDDTDPKWSEGKIMIMSNWASSMPKYIELLPEGTKTEVNLEPVAQNAKTTGIVCRPSQVFSIYGKSKYPVDAVQFLNALFTDEKCVTDLKDQRGVPSSSAARDILEKNKLMNPLLTKTVELAQSNVGIPQNSIRNDEEIMSIAEELIQAVGYGQKTPEAAADEFFERIQERLDDMKTM